jgi:O-antigen ligase
MWTYDKYGLFGAGLGTGTQGTQHFGGGGAVGSGAAEGGLGKITLELGIPGLFVMGWIAIVIFRYLWQIMRLASRHSRRLGRLSFGFFSFLVANLAGFSVATQAFGDLFILLILSWTLGFLLAVPILVEREVHARQPAIIQDRNTILRPKIA